MDNLEKDVREELAKHGSVFKTCRHLGIDNVEYVSNIANDMKKDIKPDLSGCSHDGMVNLPSGKTLLLVAWRARYGTMSDQRLLMLVQSTRRERMIWQQGETDRMCFYISLLAV